MGVPVDASAHFELSVIDSLVGLLSEIKLKNGDMSADLLHNNSEFEMLEENARMSAKYQSLRRLKPLRDALRALLDIAETKIKRLEHDCTPFFHHMGIKSLPDDILRYVFEAAYDSIHKTEGQDESQSSSGFSFTLSSVSRQFRHVALSTPRIWSHLNTAMSPDQLALHMSRSKNVSLDILIDDGNGASGALMSFDFFMETTTKESQRWQTVLLDIDGTVDQLSTLCRYRNIQIPRLAYLAFSLDRPDEQTSKDMCSVLESWDVAHSIHPSLANCFIPKSAPCIQLSSLEVILSPITDEDGVEKWDCFEILLDLVALPLLESLSLRFSDATDIVDVLETAPLTLRKLMTLSIVLETCNLDIFVPSLFRNLQLPVLSNLTVTLAPNNSGEFTLDSLLPDVNPYPSIESISLVMEPSVFGVVRLGIFRSRLPSLKHICIYRFFGSVLPFYGVHPWQRVRFQDCTLRLDDADARDLADVLMRGPTFQILELVGCTVSPRCLKSMRSRMGSKLTLLDTRTATHNYDVG